MPLFTSPTVRRQNNRGEELWFTGVTVAKTVVKKDGAWRTMVSPTPEYLNTCDVVMRGGYVHNISQTLADELTAAGYGDYISG